MDKLKELLGDLYEQVIAKLGTTKILIDDGTLIPKYRLDEVLGEKKAALEQVKKSEEDLKVLKEKASGNDSLTAQITELQRANKAAKEEFELNQLKSKKSTAVLVALMDAGVGDPAARDLLSKGIDINKVELDEAGKPKGFETVLKPIKENKAFAGMFGTSRIIGQEHIAGESPNPISALETKLAEAQKSGKLIEVVSLRQRIAEESAKK
jgi:hypothetical protein